jgi:hypothetical protein
MVLDYFRKKIQGNRTKPLLIKNKKNNINEKFKGLNFQYKSYGNKNPEKLFYIIRRTPGAGFFSNLNFILHNILICKKLKMIPVIDMENYPTIHNCKIKINNSYNAWLYYFKPVSKYTLSEVYQSKNVILCDNKTSKNNLFNKDNYYSEFKYFNGFQYLTKEHRKIFKKYIVINKEILKKAEDFSKKYFKGKILGVCFRGSDQKTSGYQPYPPTEEQMLNATNALIKKYKFDYIYICTEDINYLNLYKKNYQNKILYYDNPRTDDKKDLFNANDNKHRYKIGLGNLIDMLLLSKTDYLLYAMSNIPAASIFYSNRNKFQKSIIDNGMKGNIFISQYSFYLRKILPYYFGGFKKNILDL